jgi:hypothetical protein
MTADERLNQLEEEVKTLRNRLIYQDRIIPGSIKQRHLEANIIFTGLAANKPDGSTEVKAYFETDTGVLNIWDGSQWLTITLS